MAQDSKQLIDSLNALVTLDFDAVSAYESAIKRIEAEPIRDRLRAFQADHVRHIDELSRAVRELNGEPPHHADAKGVLLQAFTAVTSMMGDRAALMAMRSNEELTNRTYDEALEQVWPLALQALIERNRQDERRHLAFVEEAIEAFDTDDAVSELTAG